MYIHLGPYCKPALAVQATLQINKLLSPIFISALAQVRKL